MRSIRKYPFRTAGRLFWLGAELTLCAFAYIPKVAGAPATSKREAKARWLQYTCRRLLPVFNLDIAVQGTVPARGLLVSNHLGYLDIVTIGAVTPTVFISKSEVANWPVFGWFARMSGTVFVRRDKRTEVGRSAAEIQEALGADVMVVLFPEGTSSAGETVLPFKSALLEPAAANAGPLAVAHVEYAVADGEPGLDVAYWGDMTLVPHLLNLLSKAEVKANLQFSRPQAASADRKELARRLHAEVMTLKASRTSIPAVG